MDQETKHLVASNLTVAFAYLSGAKGVEKARSLRAFPADTRTVEAVILDAYRTFLAALGESPGADAGSK